MRALLINPPIHDFSAYDLWSKPLGLLKIAASLKKSGAEVSLIDCLDRSHPALKIFLKGSLPRSGPFGSGNYFNTPIEKPAVLKEVPRILKRYGMPKELFADLIQKEPRPDVILVTSGMTYWYPSVFEAISMLKERFKGVPLILGGIYAKLLPEHAKKYSGADLVSTDNSLSKILETIEALTGKALNTLKDLAEENIFPAYELYSELPYATLRTSTGCPFKCSYCAWYLLENEFHQIDPYLAVQNIEDLYKNKGVKNFAFYDEAFLYNSENHFSVIAREIIKRGIKAAFLTPGALHARYINSEIANLMKGAGFVNPRLGFETASAERQKITGDKTTNTDFLKAIDNLVYAGYDPRDIGVNLLVGLPGQDLDEVASSADFLLSRNVRIFLEEYSPIPGTAEYLKTGLSPDADPLLHNNTAFCLMRHDHKKLQALKDHVHKKI